MATRQETTEFILDQLHPLPVRVRAMFGEYALYLVDKVVAFICDDTLFMKPTSVGAELLSEADMAPAYPGSKLYYAVPRDKLEDREWLQDFVVRTAELVPSPKPKKPKAKPAK